MQLLGGTAGRGRLGGPVLVLPQSGDRVGQRTELGEQREQLLVLAPADEPGGGHRHRRGAQPLAGRRRRGNAPPRRGPGRAVREAAAKRVCRRCPVVQDCAAYALASGERYGVWGGMTEAERARIAAAGRPGCFRAEGRSGRRGERAVAAAGSMCRSSRTRLVAAGLTETRDDAGADHCWTVWRGEGAGEGWSDRHGSASDIQVHELSDLRADLIHNSRLGG